jgi:DNA-binding response OmpR family regulator
VLSEKLRDIIDAKSSPGRVLLVEDEELIQELAMEYLEEVGIKVDTATSGTDALNKLQLVPGGVDAVILDMGLPDRRGDDLVREIRSVHPTLPIVIASGRDSAEIRNLLADTGSVVSIRKPYAAEDLRAALRSFGIPC